MEIIGYKCFNKDLTNNYGRKFEVGKIYIAPGIIKFGISGNGFHLCRNLEDTLRYYPAKEKDVSVCLVKGSGNYQKHDDEYYGYYDMYSFEKIEILKKLTREEIIKICLNLCEIQVIKFISTFKLTEKEIEKFKEKYKDKIRVLDAIAYYQENDFKVYEKKYNLLKKYCN